MVYYLEWYCTTLNRIRGVMVSVLVSSAVDRVLVSSAVDRGFETQSGQT